MKYIVFENETLLARGLAAAMAPSAATEAEAETPAADIPDGLSEPHIFRFQSNLPLEEVEKELRSLRMEG
jgi:hypothetical protein